MIKGYDIMGKIDIFSFGFAYELILFMLFAVFVVDCVSIIKCLRSGKEEIKEYAKLCIKYLKIIMCVCAGVFFLIVAFTYGYDFATSLIHAVLGFMMLTDAAVCLIIKLKYRK